VEIAELRDCKTVQAGVQTGERDRNALHDNMMGREGESMTADTSRNGQS
jgi:hypothetical protein